MVMVEPSWVVGSYELNPKPIGYGSFGTIYRARRVTDGLRVAFKLVVLTADPESGDKVAAERRGAILQDEFEKAHGMVPKVYDYGTHDGYFYIAMELIEGGALSQLIAKGPVEPKTAAGYAARICDFLEKAHQFATTIEGEPYARIVHADLKPQHVLMTRDGQIKVLDFGIAKALANKRSLTINSWVTVDYASPEHLESGYVNEHDDFWAVGVMLYEMVSGHRPYSRLDALDDPRRTRLQRAIMNNAPREPLPPSCPAPLVAIINKVLAYQVDRRYPTAAAIKA